MIKVDSLDDDHWRIKDSLEKTVHRMMLDSHGLGKLLVVVLVVNDHGTTMTRAEDIDL